MLFTARLHSSTIIFFGAPRFGIKHNVALLMAVTVLILNVIAWRATEETGRRAA